MDPAACLASLLDALAQGDWSGAREWAAALNGWLDRDGFPPHGWKRSQTYALTEAIFDVLDAREAAADPSNQIADDALPVCPACLRQATSGGAEPDSSVRPAAAGEGCAMRDCLSRPTPADRAAAGSLED